MLGYLRPDTWERTWDWGTPPPRVRTDKQTENITFPHPSIAGGNYYINGFEVSVYIRYTMHG